MCPRTRATRSLFLGTLLSLFAFDGETASGQSLEGEQQLTQTGSRVRVTGADNHQQTGTVVSLSRDTVVGRWDDGVTSAVALDGVTRLDVSIGRKGNAKRVARIGFLGGIAVGAIIGLVEKPPQECEIDSGDNPETRLCRGLARGTSFVVNTLAGGGAGAIYGLFLGALVRTERWAPSGVGVGPRRVGLFAPARSRGTALGLSLAF
jgi:hypothetical protein